MVVWDLIRSICILNIQNSAPLFIFYPHPSGKEAPDLRQYSCSIFWNIAKFMILIWYLFVDNVINIEYVIQLLNPEQIIFYTGIFTKN